MKKSLLVAAIAASLVGVAQAETTLYGSLRASVNYNDQYNTAAGKDDGNWDLSTQSSRFGIKGSEDLGNGLTAAYQFEFKVNTSNGGKDGLKTRLAWVGLVGNFGTVALGRQQLPYYNVLEYNDAFNAPFSYDGYYLFGANRISNALAYVSPNFNGFQLQAAVVMSGNDASGGRTDDVDAYNIAALYDNAGFHAGLSYLQVRLDNRQPNEKDTKFVGASLGYSNDVFKVGLAGELAIDAGQSATTGNWEDVYEVNLLGEYYYGDHTFRAAVAYVDNEIVDDDGMFYGLGYQYDFTKRTRLWVEGAYYDGGDGGVFGKLTGDAAAHAGTGTDFDGFTVSVGLRHDF